MYRLILVWGNATQWCSPVGSPCWQEPWVLNSSLLFCISLFSESGWIQKQEQNPNRLKTVWMWCQSPRSFCFLLWSVQSFFVMWLLKRAGRNLFQRELYRTVALHRITVNNRNKVRLSTVLIVSVLNSHRYLCFVISYLQGREPCSFFAASQSLIFSTIHPGSIYVTSGRHTWHT